jgi:succinoglycan biosynthesis transport protein ExoP
MTTIPATIQERIPIPAGPVARPGTPQTPGLGFSDIMGAIKQRLFLIIFVWLFLMGIVVVGTWLWIRYWPKYTAKSQILVESPKPEMPFAGFEEPFMNEQMMERVVMDQTVLVRSDDVMLAALGDSAVQNTHWYRSFPPEERPGLVKELQEKLSVSPIHQTNYITVAISCKNPDDPHVIVNTVVEKYLHRADQLTRIKFNEQLAEYRDEKERLDAQIQETRRQRDDFIATQMNMPGVTQGVNTIGEALQRLTQEITSVETEKVMYKAVYDNLRAASPDQLSISPEMRLMIESDPKVARLNEQLSNLQQALELQRNQLGEKHRLTRELENQAAVIEEQLNRELAKKEDQVRRFELEQAEMAWLNAIEAETQLQERRMELEDRQRDLDRQMLRLQSMDEDLKRLDEKYAEVSDYIRMLQLVTQKSSTVRVQRISSAARPIERSFPQWYINILAGTVLSLGIAIGLALLLEFADTSVRTPRDVSRHVNVPMLGTIPDVDDEEVDIEQIELAVRTTPRSMIAEAFRNIRTNLQLSAPAERQRAVLIASPKPEDGKTTVATNLAMSIAQGGRRVLLVDANFRRPVLHRLFPNRTPAGLCNILIGRGRLEELVHKTDLPNLDVLFAGPSPPNPAELLGSSYMREMLAQAMDRYDQIIFDGPPILLVSDGLVLAGHVDGVVLVCRAKANSRGIAARAREQLERVNAHIFGAVLNGAQVRRGGYFREQLRTFYDYHGEEALAGATAALPDSGRSLDGDDETPNDEVGGNDDKPTTPDQG